MKQKLKNKKGFTLVELLTVVAIIGVLIAISIPLVTGATEKAAVATDAANQRAAKAVAYMKYMLDDPAPTGKQWYNLESGDIETETPSTPYGESKDNKENAIQVDFGQGTATPTVSWETPTSGGGGG